MEASVRQPDVLIVGGGLSGCALAVALKRRGQDVLLVEKLAAPKKIFKGEYLQPAAVKLLESIGFAEIFNIGSSERVRELRFRDLNEKGEITSDLLMAYPRGEAARSIHHHELVSGMQAVARRELQDNFIAGAQVEPLNHDTDNFFDAPQFKITMKDGNGMTVQPKWVVGCDGRMSSVRKWMGGRTVPKNDNVVIGAGHEFIMGLELPSQAPRAERYEVIRTAGQGTLSAFSLGESGQRIYFSAHANEADPKGVAVKIKTAISQINTFHNLGEMPEKAQVMGFPAQTSWFGPIHRGAFLLAGDAGSVTTPYGGQGMTVATAHVKYLLEQLDWNITGQVARELELQQYEKFVRSTYQHVNLLNFGLYYLFFARQSLFKGVTSYVVRNWDQNEESKNRVMRLFAGLDTDTPSVPELIDLWGVSPATLIKSGGLVWLKNYLTRTT